uniref:Uncharacterized protein n=1 Tax=Romanomermis culicivorax TaxID=13658 RepID=A0A915JIT5_ROMCU
MKVRFTTIDLLAIMHDIRKCIGMRVNNVYDIDHKTYLIKLMKPDGKAMILLESGNRIHLTDYEYQKNTMPSGFSMKLRKHIKQKRLEKVEILGVDRIIDLCFGSGEVACHVIVELYDRGNIVLTDHEYLILNVLRPRTDKENSDVKFVVREKYPLNLARQDENSITKEKLVGILNCGKPNDNMRKILTPNFVFGPALLEHCLLKVGMSSNTQLSKIILLNDADKLCEALQDAHNIFHQIKLDPSHCCGIISLKRDKRPLDGEIIETYQEFHPILFEQIRRLDSFKKFDTFNQAVDEFFSKMESQKLDSKNIQQEKTVIKKLENVKRDHENRLKGLQDAQSVDKRRAELIEMNKDLVDRAILVVNSALANQMSWSEIKELLDEAKLNGDRVANVIKSLKLEINHLTLKLADPFHDQEESNEDDESDDYKNNNNEHFAFIDVDLGMNAYQNACKYYTSKKQSAVKEQKTLQASDKALKSAEQKTQELLKQVQINRQINKFRKTFWFEKFLWFISSDGYLVVGGREAQQNELLVKRYLKTGDAYVHADIRGASSVIVKNRALSSVKAELPPKTLSEAGTMAICHSAAWDAKVVTSAWWVHADQVTKTAPAGEYLTTGSFMIRGKKNFLPPCQLVMGFGVMFKLDDESAAKRLARKRINEEEENDKGEVEVEESVDDDVEIKLAENQECSDHESDKNLQDMEEFPDICLNLPTFSAESDQPREEYSVINIGLNRTEKTSRNKNQQSKNQVQSSTNSLIDGSSKSDQDEEERELRLKLLGSKKAVATKVEKVEESGEVSAKNEAPEPRNDGGSMETNLLHENETTKLNVEENQNALDGEILDDPVEEDEIFKLSQETLQATDALVGIPAENDPDEILLYAVPVCAPYSIMVNWKYKVKLTPGTGKRGKATKTALEVFIRDKNVNQREKELLKAMGDQDMSRNLPGKVKVSAPRLQEVKRKR